MDNKASITALMSAFGRAFHAENEDHPVFADDLAKELMTEESMPPFRAMSSAERGFLSRRSTLRPGSRRNWCAGL